MSVETIRTTDIRHSPRQLQIDFLFLDLAKCTRCRATDRSLSEALTVVAEVLKAAGIEVKVTKVHVATEELARTWRFVSSPTIRVNGADIALELRESSCGSEACTDGCGGQIACRVWVHQGQEYTEPPPELIVDAILRHVYGAPAAWTGRSRTRCPRTCSASSQASRHLPAPPCPWGRCSRQVCRPKPGAARPRIRRPAATTRRRRPAAMTLASRAVGADER
jgi:hypothetical protein